MQPFLDRSEALGSFFFGNFGKFNNLRLSNPQIRLNLRPSVPILLNNLNLRNNNLRLSKSSKRPLQLNLETLGLKNQVVKSAVAL